MSLAIKYFFDARKKRKQEWVAEENYFEKAEGTFTVQYPKESIPIPDHGRYQLHNEIEDCIVCDKCAKICPVDCIDIEPVRSPEVFGHTSDGTPLRIHAAKFDIDMAKCCFCGLCTVVCPTECLTMTKEFDFSTNDILDHNFSFSKMSEKEISEKKQEFEDYQAAKAQPQADLPEVGKKPIAKPMMKPKVSGTTRDPSTEEKKARPVFKPKVKPVMKPIMKQSPTSEDTAETEKKAPAKPAMKPKMKPVVKPVMKPKTSSEEPEQEAKKQMKKPIMKPKIPKKKL